jgi:hypothetical protein
VYLQNDWKVVAHRIKRQVPTIIGNMFFMGQWLYDARLYTEINSSIHPETSKVSLTLECDLTINQKELLPKPINA